MKKSLQYYLQNYHFYSSAKHDRALINCVPMLICKRNKSALSNWKRSIILGAQKIRNNWDNVYISLKQLVFGTYMIIAARRLKLCENYFKAQHGKD